jgi:3-hydroxybutyrate dehydrogenase
MSPSFSGKSVVITGSSRGIGLGIARRFAEAGASLHLVANDAAVHDRARELGASSAEADIADRQAAAAALEPLQRIDVLINNAGLELMTPVSDSSDEVEAAFRRIIEINVIGTALVTARALPRMQAGASIVNTASIWGRVAEPQFGAYVASKHAIIGLTKTWARELGPRRIRVNAVCPGWVRTDASMRSLGRMAEQAAVGEQELLERIVAAQALPGLMEPADVAGTYLFLASDLAANITGQSLGVDRGEVPW